MNSSLSSMQGWLPDMFFAKKKKNKQKNVHNKDISHMEIAHYHIYNTVKYIKSDLGRDVRLGANCLKTP